MKRNLKVILAVLALMVCVIFMCVSASATDSNVTASGTCGDNVNWTLYSDGLLKISGSGNMTDYTYSSNAPWYSYRFFNVKQVIIEDSVTSIGDLAFYNCTSLTSVTIPNSVTSIGGYAFSWCTSLTSVTIPNSVTSIGKYAFYNCTSLTSVTIDNYRGGVGIGSNAFPESATVTYTCLARGTCGDNVNWTLYGDGLLKISGSGDMEGYIYMNPGNSFSINMPWSSYRTKIKKVIIEDGVASISCYAFDSCPLLTDVTIPNSVTKIGDYAFNGCSVLTSVTIDNYKEAVTIGSDAFPKSATVTYTYASITASGTCGDNVNWTLYDDGLLKISGSGDMNAYQSIFGPSPWYSCRGDITNVVIEDGVTSIGGGAFEDCSSLTSIEIPNSVTSIEDGAFEDCSSLTSIEIPNSVTSIGDAAFYDCENLTSIEIPNSVTSIGASAFRDCSNLTSIEIPNSVTSIGASAFRGCNSLTSINVDDNNEVYCDIDGVLFSKDKTVIYIYPERRASAEYSIPNSVTSIEASAFYRCSITSIKIPNSVTSIGDGAFEYCSSLTSIEIPNSVTSIRDSAFKWCHSLTSIEIPDSVTSIGDGAFEDCSSLTSIEIPNSVTSIGNSAFAICENLTSIEIPNSVTSIGKSAFYYCDRLESIKIPNSVTSIGYGVFNGCSALTSATIENKTAQIGAYAFGDCPLLTIRGYKDSTAEEYANANNIPFEKISEIDYDFLKFKEYQIRSEKYNGLRSIFSVDLLKMSALEENGLKVIEYGAILASTEKLIQNGDELIVMPDANGNYVTVSYGAIVPIMRNDKIINKVVSYNKEELRFAFTIINYTVDNYSKQASFRGYAVIEDSNGNRSIIYADYSNPEYRSVSLEQICDVAVSQNSNITVENNISYAHVVEFRKQLAKSVI